MMAVGDGPTNSPVPNGSRPSPHRNSKRNEAMKTFKTRHQLFLPEHLSKRMEALAAATNRARSVILVEALEAWFERRGAPNADEAILARLTRIERSFARFNHNLELLWEAASRLVRHQLITAAGLPSPTDAERALGVKLHQAFLDEIAERLDQVDVDFASIEREGTIQ